MSDLKSVVTGWLADLIVKDKRIAELERLNAVALEAMKYVAVEYESQVLINAVEILEGAGK